MMARRNVISFRHREDPVEMAIFGAARIRQDLLGLAGFALLSGGAAAQQRPAIDAEVLREWRDVVRMCGLPSATLRRVASERYRLSLPRRLYAARQSDRVRGRIMCVDHWALEHGADLDVRRLRR